MLKPARTPGGGIALDGEKVLCAPGYPMQRPTILSGCDLGIGSFRLGQRALFRQRDDEMEFGI